MLNTFSCAFWLSAWSSSEVDVFCEWRIQETAKEDVIFSQDPLYSPSFVSEGATGMGGTISTRHKTLSNTALPVKCQELSPSPWHLKHGSHISKCSVRRGEGRGRAQGTEGQPSFCRLGAANPLFHSESWLNCSTHFLKIYLFLAALGLCCCTWLSLVAVSGGYSSLRYAGFSLRWLLLLRSTGSRAQAQ